MRITQRRKRRVHTVRIRIPENSLEEILSEAKKRKLPLRLLGSSRAGVSVVLSPCSERRVKKFCKFLGDSCIVHFSH